MKTILRTLGLTIIVIIILIIIFLIYSSFEDETLEFEIKSRIEEYENGITEIIDFGEIDYFEWDNLYIYNDYYPCSRIVTELNAPYYSLRCSGLSSGSVDEFKTLYIFMRNEIIVKDVEMYGRSNSYLNSGISPGEAFFILDENFFLEWIGEQ